MSKTTAFCLALLGLAGCSRVDHGQDAAMQKRLADLEAKVAKLDAKVSTSDSNETGAWVLWRHRTQIESTPGFIVGPAPAMPIDAFDSKQACVNGAWSLSNSRLSEQFGKETADMGSAPTSASSVFWMENDGTSIDKITFSCLPRGVTPKF